MGVVVALPTTQPILDCGHKGDKSFSWAKMVTNKGEVLVGFLYGSYQHPKRIHLWKWMESHLPLDNWMICKDLNQIKRVDDSIGPSPLMHGLERRAWNRLADKLDLLDNRLIIVQKIEPRFTRHALHGECFNQSRIDRTYCSDRGR